MTGVQAWGHESRTRAVRARWFGIFRREVRLKDGVPGRLTIPAVEVAVPERLPLADAESRSTPGCLPAEWPAPVAVSLGGFPDARALNRCGSVALHGVMFNEEPVSPPVSRPRLTALTQPAGEVSTPAATEIPLSKRLGYLLQPPTDLLLSGVGPLEWSAPLFQYQLDGIQALLSRNALLLADDMGLGKTIQAIGALRILVHQHRIVAALLVVPTGLLSQWRKELRRWAPELAISTVRGPADERAWQWDTPAHVYLTSYETLRSDCTDNPQSPPRRRVWDVVILDEAQKIKNRDAQVSRKCKQLLRRRAWVLTGTPLENCVDDLASILEFVSTLKEGEQPLRLLPGPALGMRHKELQLRRKKSDVLPQLPPKIVSQITLNLDGAQRNSYERAEKEGIVQLRAKGETIRVENVLELITRLKQICNFCPDTGRSAKLEDIRERLNTLESEGHRALIFSQFTDDRHGVRRITSELQSLQPLLYTGDLSLAQRTAIISEFRENLARKVLVLSVRAGGQGLNLQEASYVFHFDRWWNPAIERQAEDRSHRLGQTVPVHVYKYICEGTIEEKIDRILQEKQLLFDEMVDGVSIDLKSKFTEDELFGLFGLTPPVVTKAERIANRSSVDFGVMRGIEFEEFVMRLLEQKGWRVEANSVTRDEGIDLIARRHDDLGLEMSLYVQCKNHSAPVGVEVVRALNGSLPKHLPGTRGVVICPSGFTVGALIFARDRGLALWNRAYLIELSRGQPQHQAQADSD